MRSILNHTCTKLACCWIHHQLVKRGFVSTDNTVIVSDGIWLCALVGQPGPDTGRMTPSSLHCSHVNMNWRLHLFVAPVMKINRANKERNLYPDHFSLSSDCTNFNTNNAFQPSMDSCEWIQSDCSSLFLFTVKSLHATFKTAHDSIFLYSAVMSLKPLFSYVYTVDLHRYEDGCLRGISSVVVQLWEKRRLCAEEQFCDWF